MPKTLREREAKVNRLVAKWKPRLLLDNWSVRVQCVDEILQGEEPSIIVDAEITPYLRYQDSKMIIRPSFFAKPNGYQKITIIHELTHCFVEPTRQLLLRAVRKGALTEKECTDAIEAMTDHIAKVVFAAYSRRNSKNFHI